MAQRGTSQHLIGRDDEMSRLTQLVTRLVGSEPPGDVGVVLIGGEAGVGKTRLVRELRQVAADEGVVMLIGHCVEDGAVVMPLNPVTEIIRHVRADGLAGRDVAASLAEAMENGLEPARLFQLTSRVLEACAANQAVIVVFEDLHWADDSTRDLISVLARSMAGSQIMIVGTYRTDELHRRHPLLPFLAGIERSHAPERLELEPLSPDEVRELARGIRGESVTEASLERLYQRVGGNPFLAEELLMAETADSEIPSSLRQVVLAQCLRLDPRAAASLEAASILSPPISHAVLQLTTALTADEHSAAVDELAGAGLLVPLGAGLGFRHELVREVVADELLPGERTDLHEKAAAALRTHQPSNLGQIARHYLAAVSLPPALETLVAAGRQAMKMGAAPEAAGHLGRAIDIFGQVPDADRVAGCSYGELLQIAARASKLSRRFDVAVELARQAAIELLEVDETIAGAAYFELAEHLWNANAPGFDEALQRARELVPAAATKLSAEIDSLLAYRYATTGDSESAERLADRAVETARAVGAYAVAAAALSRRAAIAAHMGDDSFLDPLRSAIEEAANHDDDYGEIGRAAGNLMHCLLMLGRHEETPAVLERWIGPVTDRGFGATIGAMIQFNGFEGYEATGRWDDAERMLQGLYAIHDEESIRRWSSGLIQGYGHILIAQGRFEEATSMATRAVGEYESGYYSGSHGGIAAAQIELAARGFMPPVGDAVIRQRLERGLPAEAVESARAVAVAARFRVGRYSGPDARRAAEEWIALVEDAVAEHWVATPLAVTLWLDQARAELSSATGDLPDPGWAQIAGRWAAMSRPYQEAYARYREAETALHSSPGRSRETQDAAVSALRRASSIARELEARPLLGDIEDLARRARLELAEPPSELSEAPNPFGLTKREREVLDLVIEGRSNGEIGDELFISTKTASVHVSNILRKMEAKNRIEAAAIARSALAD